MIGPRPLHPAPPGCSRRAALAALAALAAGCHPAPLAPPPAPAAPRLHLDPLTDLVAAGGLDALALVRWSELQTALAAPLARLLPPERLAVLGTYLGFDLRSVEQLLVASYGPTSLYVLRVPHDPQQVEKLFRERLTGDVVRSNDGPGVVRVSGRIGSIPRALALLLPDTLAYEVGPSGPLKAVVAFAQERLKKARPALRTSPLEALVAPLGDAPLRLLFPSPATSWQGAHGLLERASAAGVAFTPRGSQLAVRATLLGAWNDPPTEALRRLGLTVSDLSNAPLGHLTGLDEPLEPYRYEGDAERIAVTATLDAERLARGLHDITGASLRDLFPGLGGEPPARP